MRKPVGNCDVVDRDLDVLDHAAPVLDPLPWPLMLMKQSDAADQRQILHVIAPGARLRVEERQLPRVGIGDEDGLQEPLRVAMHGKDGAAVPPLEKPFKRLRLALHAMDGLRLRPVFIDGENKTAIQHLLVEIDGRRRQEDHHRAFDAVLMREQAPRRRVFARAWRWSTRLRTATASTHRPRECTPSSSTMASTLCFKSCSPM